MKKILFMAMALTICASVFAQETSITFKKKEYKLAHALEFNDDSTWDELCKHHWWIPAEEEKPVWYHITRKDARQETNKDGFIYIKDGVLHLKEQHSFDENGVPFAANSEIYTFPQSWFLNKPKKKPYPYQQGFYEFKFKMPRDEGISFEMFLISPDEGPGYSANHKNKKGYALTEADFAEIISIENNQIMPHGGFIYNNPKTNERVYNGMLNETDTYYKKVQVSKEWYDQWHTLQVVWEGRKMEIYYDGKKYRTTIAPPIYGESVGDYGLIIRTGYCSDYFPAEIDWKDNSVHDFQIDYIRYYKPIEN